MSDQTGEPQQRSDQPVRPDQPVPAGWAPVQPPAYGTSYPPAGQVPSPTGVQGTGWGVPPTWGATGPGWAPPPKPGVIPLRPLGVGEILDGAISSIRRDPLVMLGVSALVVTVSTVLQSLVTWALLRDVGRVLQEPTVEVTDDQLFELLGGGVLTVAISLVISLLTQVVLTGMLTFSVSKAVLGEKPKASEAWQATRRRLPALLGLTILVFLLVAVVVVLPVLPGILALVAGAGVLGVVLLVVGVPLALVAGLVTVVLTWFAAPVVMLERQRVTSALRRSAKLVRANLWRVIGLWLLLQLLVTVFGGILGGPLALIASNAFDDPFGLGSLSLQALGTILTSTVTLPFAAAVAVLVYVDQRIRREALDLELTRAAGLAVPGQSETPGARPGPVPGGPPGPTYGG